MDAPETTRVAAAPVARTAAEHEPIGRILVVEDEPELAEMLGYNLRAAGFEVLTAADGLSACRQVGSACPDLVLLDLMLPDLDGWEICRLIRAQRDPQVATIPIIMLTALGSAEDRRRGLRLGANDYLPKPYSTREVIRRCRQLLAERSRSGSG